MLDLNKYWTDYVDWHKVWGDWKKSGKKLHTFYVDDFSDSARKAGLPDSAEKPSFAMCKVNLLNEDEMQDPRKTAQRRRILDDFLESGMNLTTYCTLNHQRFGYSSTRFPLMLNTEIKRISAEGGPGADQKAEAFMKLKGLHGKRAKAGLHPAVWLGEKNRIMIRCRRSELVKICDALSQILDGREGKPDPLVTFIEIRAKADWRKYVGQKYLECIQEMGWDEDGYWARLKPGWRVPNGPDHEVCSGATLSNFLKSLRTIESASKNQAEL